MCKRWHVALDIGETSAYVHAAHRLAHSTMTHISMAHIPTWHFRTHFVKLTCDVAQLWRRWGAMVVSYPSWLATGAAPCQAAHFDEREGSMTSAGKSVF